MGVIAAFMVPHPPLIVPEVGRGEESQIAETTEAYEKVAERIAQLQPETIVISSPHATMYADYFHISPGRKAAGSLKAFRAPQVRFEEEYDRELVKTIEELAVNEDLPVGTEGERDPELDHGTMVPLYFIRKVWQESRIVRIGLSGLSLNDHYRVGMLVKKAAGKLNRRVVYVASGDLSHKLQTYGPYGFAKEGPEYDRRIMEVCGAAAFEELFDFSESFCEKAAECGHRSFVMMAGALDGMAVRTQMFSHQDVTGVGYGICSFEVTGEESERSFLLRHEQKEALELERKRSNEDVYVRLARASLESYIRDHKRLGLSQASAAVGMQELPEELLSQQAGTFVSIHKHGNLRGCIGTFLPATDCVAQEILQNAVSAAVQDPRFNPIAERELRELEISVDVLGRPESIDSEKELDPKRYGVIVTNGRRRGLLLPDLDGVDTVERQIAIAKQKAGIAAGEEVQLQRFEVVRHT